MREDFRCPGHFAFGDISAAPNVRTLLIIQHLSSDVVDLALGAVPQAMAVKIDTNGGSPVLLYLGCSVPAPHLDAPREASLVMYTQCEKVSDDNAHIENLGVGGMLVRMKMHGILNVEVGSQKA